MSVGGFVGRLFFKESKMRVLTDLEPKNVFSFFEDICSIPHPSYKEEKISNYLVEFAKERGLEHYQDELHNVIIIKEASEDMRMWSQSYCRGTWIWFARRHLTVIRIWMRKAWTF